MDFLFLVAKLFIEACALVYFILVLVYWIAWERIPEFLPATGENKTFVSVIIAARNEEKNIGQCLEKLVNQNYLSHLFEIIIVNDFSKDNTSLVVSDFIAQQKNVKISLLNLAGMPDATGGKKEAVALAVNQAKGDLILTTDADCTMKQNWLKTFADWYEQNGSYLISGPVKFEHTGNILKIWSAIQALEFMSLIGTGAAAVRAGYPLMCNAANLAFKKEIFLEVATNTKNETASGDDTFLMFAIHQKYPDKISFLKSKEAIVTTQSQPSLKEFLNQRKRWASKVKQYTRNYVKWIGVFLFVFNICIAGLVIMFFIKGVYADILLPVILSKTLVDFVFLSRLSQFFGQRKLLLFFPLAEVLHVLYIVII
ncbi:MAG: glycosyltransferase, partial [Bacteroidia bacterium]